MPVQDLHPPHDRRLPADATGVGVFAEVRGIGVLRDLAQGDALPATGDEQRDTRTLDGSGSQGWRIDAIGRHRRGAIAFTPEVAQEDDQLA